MSLTTNDSGYCQNCGNSKPECRCVLTAFTEQCTAKLLNYFERPTIANQVALEDALRAYGDAWIRSKSQ